MQSRESITWPERLAPAVVRTTVGTCLLRGLLALLAMTLSGATICSAEAGERPHVVLILVDDMGYGDPGCYNPQSRIRTPHIDRLASDGMRFTDAHASGPLCHMSRYGLLTGQYPFRTDVSRWPKHALIAPDQLTLPKLLQRQGYHTAMVGKWHLGFEERGYDQPLPGGPVDVGFDTFFGIRASTDIPPYFYIRDNQAVQPPTEKIDANRSEGWSPIQGAFWRAGGIAPDMDLATVLPTLTQEAVSVIEQHQSSSEPNAGDNRQETPLFLYLAYPSPHTPWLPSEEFAGKSQVGMYGDFVEMVDAEIGRVLDTLHRSGMADDTLLIFTSDNGPVWYAEDVVRFEHDSAGGLRGMKADAWEAGHRMPFIVRWPQHVRAHSQCDSLISFVDIMATLASITGYNLTDEEAPDSIDFSSHLLERSPPQVQARDKLVLRSGGGMLTIRQGDWKLIDGLGSGGFSNPRRIKPTADGPTGQLYDLSKDPAEKNNLFLQQPDTARRLKQLLANELRRSRATNRR